MENAGELPLQEKTPEAQCLLELTHPDTAAQFWVLGTAHVSVASAEQATELVRRVRPDVVVLELDPERFASMVREARRRGVTGAPVLENGMIAGEGKGPLTSQGDSIPKVFGLMFKGDLPGYVGALFYGVSGAILGVLPGSEFLAAAIVANEVGARVILGDREAGVTMSRIRARALALRRTRRPLPDDSLRVPEYESTQRVRRGSPGGDSGDRESGRDRSDPARWESGAPQGQGRRGGAGSGDRDAKGERLNKIRDELRRAGCAVDTVQLQFSRVLSAGIRGERIDPTDLLDLRRCGRGLVENQRMDVISKGLKDSASGENLFGDEELEGGIRDALGREMSAVLRRTIVTERDLLLARSMQEAGLHAERVVAVVGAGHLPGIKACWEEARSPQSYRRAREYLQPQPEDVPPRSVFDYPGTLAGVAFFGALAYRRPRLATKIAGVATGFAAVGSTLAAQGVVQATRLVRQLDLAAKELPTNGQQAYVGGGGAQQQD